MNQGLFLALSYETLSRQAQSFFSLDEPECLIVGPSRAAVEDLLLGLPGDGSLGAHALSLTQVAVRFALVAERPAEPLSRLSQEAMTARVVHSFLEKRRLHYFEPVGPLPGFPRALARTLEELRMEAVSFRSLAQTGDPGRDLSLLERDYAAELDAAGLADRAAIFESAIEVVRSGRHPLLGLPLLLFDPPIRRELEKQFLQELAGRSRRVMALALERDEESLVALRRCLRALPARLPEDGTSTLCQVRRRLFASGETGEAVSDESLAVFSAAGEGLECMEIARRVRDLAVQGIPFDKIAVLVRDPVRYQPLMEEAFRRAGIPAYFQGGSARPDPSGRAFLALLRCAAERCSASRFAEYLSLAQTPVLNPDGSPKTTEVEWVPPQDEVLAALYPAQERAEELARPDTVPLPAPNAWERLLVDAAVIGGRERWDRRLRGLAAELDLQLKQLTGDEDESRQRALERRLAQVHALTNFALPLIGLLSAFPVTARWGEWLKQLETLAASSLRSPEGVVAILRELQPMADVGGVNIETVYSVLEDRLRFLRRDPPHYRYGHVLVAALEEARARNFSVVFLPGLAEGIFPRRSSEDPLLLDAFRTLLKPPLDRQDDRTARERLLLHMAAAIAGLRLVVSYPRVDVGQSRPRVPSFYALEVVRAAEGRLPELREFEKRTAASTPARLGWPAPAESALALDDAEYDLGRLSELAQASTAERSGGARHLVEVSPTLARSMRTRWKRWSKKWSGADGLCEPPETVRALLQRHRLSARPYSPTALQHFAVCPYQFFLHSIQRLRPREDSVPLQQLDPLTRGALFHAIQERLLGRLRDQDLVPLLMSRMPSLLATADEVVNELSAEYEERLAPAIPRVWASELEDLRLDVRGWLRDAAQFSPQWTPLYTELGFGLGGAQREVSLPIGVTLRGSVDLVEGAGQQLRVTDHKTGRFPARAPGAVGGGKTLQPMLYAMAVEQILGRPVTLGRLYFCTHRGGYRPIDIVANPANREKAREALAIIDNAVETAFLPAAPEKGACGYCDFRAVCGPHEETRVSRKNKDRLTSLEDLRGIP